METPPILEIAALTILEMDKDGINPSIDPTGFGRAYVILKTALNPEEVRESLTRGLLESNVRPQDAKTLSEALTARFIREAIGAPEDIQRLATRD